jgi:signal transduction histidine kinase
MTDKDGEGDAINQPGAFLAALARPMQHAMNNLVMVLQANLDAVQASLPLEDRNAVRLGRAAQGAQDLDALVRAYLRLGRPAEKGAVDSGRFLKAVLPVLNLAAGRPLRVEQAGTATVCPARPLADMGLLALMPGARALPTGTPPVLRLDGALLMVNWPLPEGAEAALAEAGLGVRGSADGVVVTLPEA